MKLKFNTLLKGGIEVVAERQTAVAAIIERLDCLMMKKETSDNLKIAYCEFQVFERRRKSQPRPHTVEICREGKIRAQNLRAAILMEK
jgi:hypothetical protein